MHWTNLGLIFIAGLNVGLAFLIWLRNPKNKINIWFSLAIFALFLWILVTALFRLVPDVKLASLLYQFKLFFGLLIAIFFQIFTLFFPHQKTKFNVIVQGLIVLPSVAALLVIAFFPSYAIDKVVVISGQNLAYVNKIFWLLYSFAFTLTFVVAFSRLISRYFKQTGFLKVQLGYVIISGLIPLVFAWFFNIFFILW